MLQAPGGINSQKMLGYSVPVCFLSQNWTGFSFFTQDCCVRVSPHKDHLRTGYEAAQLGLPLGLGAAAEEAGFYKGCFLFTEKKK